MSVIFSVNNLSLDGAIASVSNFELILKNQEIANKIMDEYELQHSQCFVAGRYMSFYCLLIDEQNTTQAHIIQMFYDCKKNIDTAIIIRNKFVLEDNRALFMQLFNQSIKNYDKDYNEVELIIDNKSNKHFISPN